MVTQVLHCSYCQGTDIVRHGTTRQGKQRYRCHTCPERGRMFLLVYAYTGQSPEVKRQIVDMALNASGIRDTARVLRVRPTTVVKELQNKRTCNKCIQPCCGRCTQSTSRSRAVAPTNWHSAKERWYERCLC
jgi:transposase-like protein